MSLIEAKAAEVHGARGGCVVCILDKLPEPFAAWGDILPTARERHWFYARAVLAEELLREAVASQEGPSRTWFNWPRWSQRVEALIAALDELQWRKMS